MSYDKTTRYLLGMCFVTSLIGIILMIIGYSKVNVTLKIEDVFNPETGANYSLEKIMESVRRNINYSEGHYYMIGSGLNMGLACSGSIALLMLNIIKSNKEENTDKFILRNPMGYPQRV